MLDRDRIYPLITLESGKALQKPTTSFYESFLKLATPSSP
jgi:hypothetical protein